jgi:tetratricopeptide (TPR) repeat protein
MTIGRLGWRCWCLPLLGMVVAVTSTPAVAEVTGQAPATMAAPFSLRPAELLQAAGDEPPASGEPVEVVLDDLSYEFDKDLRLTRRQRTIYCVRSVGAVDAWATVEADWAPWHQSRPEIRSRVVSSDGVEHWLDPATVGEATANEENRLLFGDRRVLRAPLPGVAAGAVVEAEVVTRDREPFFSAGLAATCPIGRFVSVRNQRVVFEVPENIPLRIVIHGAEDVQPARLAENGVIRVEYSWSDLPAAELPEPGLPPEVSPLPSLAFSAGGAWEDVAAAYAAIVETQLGASDVSAIARKALTGAHGRLAIVAAALRAIRRDVRYMGIEFGSAAIVPWTPAAVLQRRYGDCKDQATLLVALLRAAGIEAHVALLATGPGPDVDPNLPGLGRFNHAIVRIAGEQPLWVDPTARYARAGELPFHDQGRLALVVMEGTVGLERTPEAAAADNRYEVAVEMFLDESGPARVVETTTSRGVPDQLRRATNAAGTAKERREFLQEYVKQEYGATSLGQDSVSDPSDLDHPFEGRVEALGAGRPTSEQVHPSVAIGLGSLLRLLPEELVKQEDGASRQSARSRSAPYRFIMPLQSEARTRIVPPLGFAARPLPPSEKRVIGTLTYSRQLVTTPAGDVIVTLGLDTGPTRITAEQFEQTRAALAALLKEPALMVSFDQIGEGHLQAGRVREALEEFDRLIAVHPKEALHHTQRARALLAGGMGGPARDGARTAVATEPTSALAHRTLGWVLQHDLIGRLRARGWDRDGALRAYRTAKELDTKDAQTRGELAVLLTHDRDGVRFGKGANLAEAVAEYRALRDELKDDRFNQELFTLLARTGDADALLDLASSLTRGPQADVLAVVGVAIKEGPRAAIAVAEERFPDAERLRAALAVAAWYLVPARRYEDAAEFFDASAREGGPAAALRPIADALRLMTRVEELPTDPANPEHVARNLFLALLRPGSSEALRTRVFPLLTSTAATTMIEHPGYSEASSWARWELLDWLPLFTEETAVSIDYTASILRPVVEGDTTGGWRVRFKDKDGGSDDLVVFLAPRHGRAEVMGTRWPGDLLAREVLARIDEGDLATAQRALDWMSEGYSAGGGGDHYSSCGNLGVFWTRGDSAEITRLLDAAAANLASTTGAADAISILEAARATAKRKGEESDRFECALQKAYARSGRPRQSLAVMDGLAVSYPSSFFALRDRVWALTGVECEEEAYRLAKDWVDAHPGDPWPARLLAQMQTRRGDLEGAIATLSGVVSKGDTVPNDWNNLAWYELITGKVGADALDHARRAVEASRKSDRGSMHTLACVQAELGDAAEAYRSIVAAVELSESGELEADDWYVIGRLAEVYGLPAAARTAYARVERPTEPYLLPSSTYALAARRLARLDEAERSVTTGKGAARRNGEG